MLYLTGDLHGSIDIRKLNKKNFPEQNEMNRNDYLVVAGDAGIIWDGSKEDVYWLKWLNEKPFTTLLVDGNHENFDLFNSYPIEMWKGGKIHRLADNVIHLMRGQVFIIDEFKLFTFGGALSHDKEYRKVGKSWWPQEMPNKEEFTEGLQNLEDHNWTVDYVITHTASTMILNRLNGYKEDTPLNHYLDMLEKKLNCKKWYFGHLHLSEVLDENHIAIYNEIIRVI